MLYLPEFEAGLCLSGSQVPSLPSSSSMWNIFTYLSVFPSEFLASYVLIDPFVVGFSILLHLFACVAAKCGRHMPSLVCDLLKTNLNFV